MPIWSNGILKLLCREQQVNATFGCVPNNPKYVDIFPPTNQGCVHISYQAKKWHLVAFAHGRTTTHMRLCPRFPRICGHILFQRKEMVSSRGYHSLHDKDMYICSSKQKMASCGFCTWKNNNSRQHLVVSPMWTFIILRKEMGSSRIGTGIPLPPYQVSKQRLVLHSEEQQLNATIHWVPNSLKRHDNNSLAQDRHIHDCSVLQCLIIPKKMPGIEKNNNSEETFGCVKKDVCTCFPWKRNDI